MIHGLIPSRWRDGMTADRLARRLPLFAILLLVTWLRFARMMAEGLGDNRLKFAHETLRAVQAWENHSFFALGGLHPLGNVYILASHSPRSVDIDQSCPPLYLLLYSAGVLALLPLFGEAGFRAFKLGWSLTHGIGLGILGCLAFW